MKWFFGFEIFKEQLQVIMPVFGFIANGQPHEGTMLQGGSLKKLYTVIAACCVPHNFCEIMKEELQNFQLLIALIPKHLMDLRS